MLSWKTSCIYAYSKIIVNAYASKRLLYQRLTNLKFNTGVNN